MNTLKLGLIATLFAATTVYAQAPADAPKGDHAQKKQERFKAADKDGDGKISRDEANASLPRIAKNFDAIIFGYYDGPRLMYVARTRNGFTPTSREKLFKRFESLEINECPFANLPEAKSGRWGQGLTAEKMKECRWLRPALVGQFEFQLPA